MSFKQFVKELNGNRVEGDLIKTVLYSLATSLILVGLLYYFKLSSIEGFKERQAPFLFLAIISYALITPAIRQVRAYKYMSCMGGMMVGMTTGMTAGFLAGFYVSSTNGMFIGGFFGVALGIGLGIWNGKCCGIMGVMEGIMAGFMGGLMGAMTAFMLFNDHLIIASVLILIISAIVLMGLNYMIYLETKENERELKEDYFFTIIFTFILTFITTWLMVFGPRSALFQ